MNIRRTAMVQAAALLTLWVWYAPTEADPLRGFFRVRLTKPVDAELQARARATAVRTMAGPMIDWINDHSESLWGPPADR